jgi:hypothetical protein
MFLLDGHVHKIFNFFFVRSQHPQDDVLTCFIPQNVSLALNAVLSDSELAQLSEAGKAFAMEGRAARAPTEQGNGKEAEASSDAEKGTATENPETKVGTNQKTWLTGSSPLPKTGFR